jgi:hypothetical protein
MRQDDQIVLITSGRSRFCLHPIEKKPLNHFLPGSAVFSFGTGRCNLGRRYYLQHALNFQVNDVGYPHRPRRHGRADIGWKGAADE